MKRIDFREARTRNRFIVAAWMIAAAALGYILSAIAAHAQPIGPPFIPTIRTGNPGVVSPAPPTNQLYFDNTASPYTPWVWNPSARAWEVYGNGSAGCSLSGTTNTQYIYNGSGACNSSASFLFDGTIPVFTQFQFSGVTTSHTGQYINGQYGDCLKLGGGNCPTAYNASGQYQSFSKGTLTDCQSGSPSNACFPNGPIIRVAQVHTGRSTDCNSNPVAGDCVANYFSFLYGTASDNDQEVGFSSHCETQTTVAANYNCIAFGGEGRVSGSGISTGIGGAFGGRRETSTGSIQGLQVTANNDVSSNCVVHVDGSGQCNGIWLVGESPSGAFSTGSGLHIAGPFNDGITGNGSADSGDGACCIANFIHDDTTAPTSIDIDGTHSNAAINIVASAGVVQLNNNILYGINSTFVGCGGLTIAGNNFTPCQGDAFAYVGESASGKVSLYGDNSGAAFDNADTTGTGLALLGVPTAPTPATADNSTKVATTAYVKAQGYGTGNALFATVTGNVANDIVTMSNTTVGVQDSGTLLSSIAPKASPTFTGTPAAPTAAANTNTTQLATTAFVIAQHGATFNGATGNISCGSCTTSSFTMGGIGSTATLTPQKSGIVYVTFGAQLITSVTTLNAGLVWRIRYGTGGAPSNGAASTGTLCTGNAAKYTDPTALGTAADFTLPVTITCIASGLAIGTAVWFDIEQEQANFSGYSLNLSYVAATEL